MLLGESGREAATGVTLNEVVLTIVGVDKQTVSPIFQGSIVQQPLILYAATTRMAYNLAQKFYQEAYYAGCAPRPEADRFAFVNPPSSDPLQIDWRYHDDIKTNDAHSAQIDANRRGLIRGAAVKAGQGIIDTLTQESIEAIVKNAPLSDFSPLLLVIPYAVASRIVKPADVSLRARATSEEYIIENLPRNCFDVLELHR